VSEFARLKRATTVPPFGYVRTISPYPRVSVSLSLKRNADQRGTEPPEIRNKRSPAQPEHEGGSGAGRTPTTLMVFRTFHRLNGIAAVRRYSVECMCECLPIYHRGRRFYSYIVVVKTFRKSSSELFWRPRARRTISFDRACSRMFVRRRVRPAIGIFSPNEP